MDIRGTQRKVYLFQEVIYETVRLARLEAIKKAVDPQFIFNCIKRIGNSLPEASKSLDDESESSPAEPEPLSGNPSGEPSGASSVSSFAAAITATTVYVFINIIQFV